jgi:hypothetical protein
MYGDGGHLLQSRSGSPSWASLLPLGGKRRQLSLGPVRERARKAAAVAWRPVRAGGDPIDATRAASETGKAETVPESSPKGTERIVSDNGWLSDTMGF